MINLTSFFLEQIVNETIKFTANNAVKTKNRIRKGQETAPSSLFFVVINRNNVLLEKIYVAYCLLWHR